MKNLITSIGDIQGLIRRVFWWAGLVLLLPVSYGWFSDLPIRIFQRYPYPVEFVSEVWVDRMLFVTNLGLLCWLVVAFMNACRVLTLADVSLPSAETVVRKFVVAAVTVIVLILSLVAAYILSIDVSNIPE